MDMTSPANAQRAVLVHCILYRGDHGVYPDLVCVSPILHALLDVDSYGVAYQTQDTITFRSHASLAGTAMFSPIPQSKARETVTKLLSYTSL